MEKSILLAFLNKSISSGNNDLDIEAIQNKYSYVFSKESIEYFEKEKDKYIKTILKNKKEETSLYPVYNEILTKSLIKEMKNFAIKEYYATIKINDESKNPDIESPIYRQKYLVYQK